MSAAPDPHDRQLHRPAGRPFVISHACAAARMLIWQAWTEFAALKQWFGPKGCTIPAHAIDLRAGAIFHYSMTMPNGATTWAVLLLATVRVSADRSRTPAS